MLNTSDPNLSPTCKRCGTCCRKGGPALHLIDQDLILTGIIPLKNLFTIREGELVFNQVKKRLEPASEEIIKITGNNTDTWCCCFFDTIRKTCRIYSHRPLECRELKCWAPQTIEAIYDQDRLSRKDLLGSIPGMMELIEFHQSRCNHYLINRWIRDLAAQPSAIGNQAQTAILESIHWDQRIRQTAQEKANTKSDQLDFIFGRPIHKILLRMGWKIKQEDNGRIHLRSTSPSSSSN